MKRRLVVGGIVALALGLTAVPVRAQTTVEGGVVIHSGPVTGHVEVGSPPPVVVYREPREVIVVEHVHAPHGHAHGWWKKHGYRAVTVYYDGSRYYSRRVERPGLRAVVLFESRGRYYLGDEHDERYRHHPHEGDEDDND
jgi:hypothetical protein